MAEYIKREAVLEKCREISACEWNHRASPVSWADAYEQFAEDVEELPSADVAPVRHGRWIGHEETPEDAYWHHKCSECNVNAPFDYKMREDWDEGMDGEWYSLGLVDDGINEHLTKFCPNCGAKMYEEV